MFKSLKKTVVSGVISSVVVASSAMAAGPDYTTVSSGIDFTSTSAAVMSVAAVLLLAMVGVKKLFVFIKGI